MGCCSICASEGLGFPSATSLDPLYQADSMFVDPYSLELETYANELLDSAPWTLAADLPHVVIKTLPGSKFCAQSPVVCLDLLFGDKVDVAVVEALLLNPDARKIWDTRLSDFYQLEESPRSVYYTLVGFPFPFKNRDFVEIVTTRKHRNGTSIVMYSSDDHSFASRHERGTTHFTVVQIRPDARTRIVAQFDLKLVIHQKLVGKYLVKVLDGWTKSLVQTALLNSKQEGTDRAVRC